MWNYQALRRLDFRAIFIIFFLMCVSLLVISATTGESDEIFFTATVKTQLRWYGMGWILFLFFAGFDYRKLQEFTWLFYIGMVLLLLGLFFTPSIQNVHRWYRIPFLGFAFQPSEYAKLIVVLTLSWILEKKGGAPKALFIVLIPFLLILKQPDLGTALVLYPITLVMFYFGGINRKVIKTMVGLALIAITFVSLMFLKVLSHDAMRPFMTTVLKEYQYERLNPNTYHQRAAQTAIALGGMTGSGWHKSEFTGRQWLPAAHTDSVFAAFGEEFGFLGVVLLLGTFFGLIYFSFQVTALAKDTFGRLLSAGIAVYLAMHILVNCGMMCGFLPITGVPLVLVTYGGSSIISTMTALGILQSIYSRRFMF